VVAVVGGNYSTSPRASAVALHFNSRSGTVLASARPDLNGTIRTTLTVPHVGAGYYVIDAMQTGPSGAPAAGTPGRAVLRIGNLKKRPRSRAEAWPSVMASPVGSSGGSSVGGLTLTSGALAATLSAGLLAAGLGLLAGDRRRRQRSMPVL